MTLPINSFYGDDKSIQRSYNFFVTIINDNSRNSYLPDGEKMPEIKNYHVLNVDVPNYGFKKEIQYYGPYARTFPVLEHEGFELKITFEEDSKGTISKFINWLQRRIIVADGTGHYMFPSKNRLSSIYIQPVDSAGNEMFGYEFIKCYFLRASDPIYDYGTNESIKYEIVFGSDFQLYSKK